MVNFTNQDGNGVAIFQLRTDGRLHQGLSHLRHEVEYFRQRYRKLIRWVIFLFHLTHKSQYKMRPLIGSVFFLINGCRYYSILQYT